MKKFQKRFCSLVLSLVMVLILAAPAHAATYDYAVEGGNLKFDPTTGTITKCESSVYSANIPSEIYGVPVTAIGKSAFMSCKKITSVTIPSTVTQIGANAFRFCSNLKSIQIPSSVTVFETSGGIGYNFAECTSLEEISIPSSINELPTGTFQGCTNLKSVTLQEGLEKIGGSAFSSCKALKEIVFPDSVKEISSGAFSLCDALEKITFGTGLKRLDDRALSSLKNLSAIYFTGDAPSATSKIIDKFADGFKIYYLEGTSGWTTPTWNGFITESYKLSSTQSTTPTTPPATPSVPDTTRVTAVPTKSAVLVNGQAVAFDAYNINDNNYFKLRDLAFILSGSQVQFEVSWSQDLGAILMTSGKGYTPAGGEMGAGGSINQIATLNKSKLYLDGRAVDLTAYTIHDNNYFKLRDIGELFNFSVEWNGASQQIMIDTNRPYGG